jgi:hypothetical protein
MKKRSIILSLALFFAVPLGLATGVGTAHAQDGACYVDSSDGGLEPAPNFQDPDSCYQMARGYWI